MRVPPGSLGLEGRNRIAVVVGEGAITRSGVGDDGLSEEGITSEEFNQILRRVENDAGIKGVVVRIDSPGGEVTASDEIWRQMRLLSRKKPMVISFSDTAASGGYYMALTGDPIVAYPGTITGSIGVVFGKADLRGLYNKLGITKDMITRGRFAAIDSDYKPLDVAEQQKLRESIEHTYRDFVAKVAEARKRPFEEMEQVAQGRVWVGSQARERGLVDELGGIDRAIEMVKRKAHIPVEEKVAVELYPRRRSLLEMLFSRSPDDMVQSRMAAVLKVWRPWLSWGSGSFLRLMPYAVEVR
jgi:protease-4